MKLKIKHIQQPQQAHRIEVPAAEASLAAVKSAVSAVLSFGEGVAASEVALSLNKKVGTCSAGCSCVACCMAAVAAQQYKPTSACTRMHAPRWSCQSLLVLHANMARRHCIAAVSQHCRSAGCGVGAHARNAQACVSHLRSGGRCMMQAAPDMC